ncbi:MAG: hypothetical protein ABIH42_03400 [Planctomycetota bacterium]
MSEHIELVTPQDDEGKKLGTCEQLMLKGVMRVSDLARYMEVSIQKASSMKKKVLREWKELAKSAGSAQALARFVRKAELVERTAWSVFSQEEDSTEKKTNVLKIILSAIDKEAEFLGFCDGKVNDETTSTEKTIADCERKIETILGALEESGDKQDSQ